MKVMEKLLGLKEGSPEARELRMCTSFANSGPLPLLFVDSIFGAHPGTYMYDGTSHDIVTVHSVLISFRPWPCFFQADKLHI